MKFKIIQKLFLLVILPIITLLIFSANHIADNYEKYISSESLLSYSLLIEKSSDLIHNLQIERGLSSTYLGSKKDLDYFKDELIKHKKITDLNLNNFIENVKRQSLSTIQTKLLKNVQNSILKFQKIREKIILKKISYQKSFIFYSNFNDTILRLIKSLKLYSKDEIISTNILAMQDIVSLQEASGKERALVAYMINLQSVNPKDLQKLYAIIHEQEMHFIHTNELLNYLNKTNDLKNIYELDKDSYIQKVRDSLFNSNLHSIQNKEWLLATTKRIDNFHKLEANIFSTINNKIIKNQKKLKRSLIQQVAITVAIILFLLLTTYLIAHKINRSISTLSIGISEFFKFLNFNRDEPYIIDTNSKDELNDMAQYINNQIALMQNNLDKDKDFINEITQIVTLMKDGDFSEKPYFEPYNPNLVELKTVFDELIDLISQKIKEQTDELHEVNSSLEDQVFNQTLELQNKIDELTLARDKAIQAELAKDEFLANMSHEIRTPLNAILGFVTILKKHIKDEKPLNYLNIINNSGKSLLTIINDILDFSKIQSGKFIISPYPLNPVDEFSNAILLFASKAYEKNIIYVVHIDPNLAQTISLDGVRVKQILGNVLSNAIKFTSHDGIIHVEIKIQDDILSVAIKDSGIGISKVNQTKVFSAFEQADGSTTRKYGGTGLGLSISYKLAKLMEGDLTLESEENVGSTFTLKLPIKILNNSPRELIKKYEISQYKFVLLNVTKSCQPQIELIKKYLTDFGATDIIELNKYQANDYDILFFIPDEDYNEDIVSSTKPAIAMLRSSFIKLADFEHIKPLYAPFLPKSIIEALNDVGIDKIILQNTIETENTSDEKIYTGKVLVAEDNKTNQMLIGLILDDYEIEYNIVNNGLEAIDIFKKQNYDMVLMDENMPELNGIEAMKKIKEYEKDKKLVFTPIIALTASVLDTDKERFLDAGMDGFVGKPIDNKDLEAVFDKYLKRR